MLLQGFPRSKEGPAARKKKKNKIGINMGVLRIFLPIKASLLVEMLHAIGNKFRIDREKLVFRPALAGKKEAIRHEAVENLEGSLLAHVAFRPLEEIAIDKGTFVRDEDFLDVGPFAFGQDDASVFKNLINILYIFVAIVIVKRNLKQIAKKVS